MLASEPSVAVRPDALTSNVVLMRSRVVRFPDANRTTLDRMSTTLLVSASGRTATLGSLASIVSTPGETEIRRENLQRLVQVTGRLEGVDLGSGIAAVQK